MLNVRLFFKFVWRCVRVLLIIGGIAFYVGVCIWASQFNTSFEITGHVEDADTGQRVPNAKVIVAAWKWWGFDANPHKFGTTTDENGNFRISASPGFIVTWRDVMASAPTGKYDKIRNLAEDYAPLGVRLLTYWRRDWKPTITPLSRDAGAGRLCG
jgi:hypothetical protein